MRRSTTPTLVFCVLGGCAAQPTWLTSDEARRMPVVPLVIHPDLRFGSAVVLDERHLLTCTHLVARAEEAGGFAVVPSHCAMTDFRVVATGGEAAQVQVEGDLSQEEMEAVAGDWAILELREPLRGATPVAVSSRRPSTGEDVEVIGFLRTAGGVSCVIVPAKVMRSPEDSHSAPWFLLRTSVAPESVRNFSGLSGGLVGKRDPDGSFTPLGILRGTFGDSRATGIIVLRPAGLDVAQVQALAVGDARASAAP